MENSKGHKVPFLFAYIKNFSYICKKFRMEKNFVSYTIALKLKELGFDEKCFASYYTDIEENRTEKYDVRKKLNASFDWDPFTDEEDSGYILNSDKEYYVSAPLWQQTLYWFREKHNYSGEVYYYDSSDFGKWHFDIEPLKLDGERYTIILIRRHKKN